MMQVKKCKILGIPCFSLVHEKVRRISLLEQSSAKQIRLSSSFINYPVIDVIQFKLQKPSLNKYQMPHIKAIKDHIILWRR